MTADSNLFEEIPGSPYLRVKNRQLLATCAYVGFAEQLAPHLVKAAKEITSRQEEYHPDDVLELELSITLRVDMRGIEKNLDPS